MQEKVMEFQKFLEEEIGNEIDKIVNSGTMTPTNICTMKDAFKLMKLIGEYDEMENGYSSRRGRSRTTGRYMSRDNSFGSYDGMSRRSYDGSYENRGSYERSGHTQIISELEKLYGKAQDERERMMIDEWIRRAEQN